MSAMPKRPHTIIFISAIESFHRGPFDRRKRSRRLTYRQTGIQKIRPGAARQKRVDIAIER